MSELKCPYCGEKLVRHWGMEEPALYCCDNPKCSRGGVATESSWQELTSTRKALNVAIDEVTKIKVAAESVGIGFFMTAAIFALEKIKTALTKGATMNDTEIRMMHYTMEQLSAELQATRQYVSDIETKLERTRKALELAITGLKNCKTRDHIGAVCRTPEYVDKVLEQIKTALEQKDVK